MFFGVRKGTISPVVLKCNCSVLFFKVTVIGVHSPKYEHEKNKANVRHAVDEQSLPFTVVNDNGLQAWKLVGCQIWPTALVFGPDALPIFIFEGENHVQHLETFLTAALVHYKSSVRASPSTSAAVQGSPEDLTTTSGNEPVTARHTAWSMSVSSR